MYSQTGIYSLNTSCNMTLLLTTHGQVYSFALLTKRVVCDLKGI